MLNPWRDYLTRKSGIVNLKTNTSFRGVIWQAGRKYLILRNAELLSGDLKKLDGEVVIDRRDIEFIQVI